VLVRIFKNIQLLFIHRRPLPVLVLVLVNPLLSQVRVAVKCLFHLPSLQLPALLLLLLIFPLPLLLRLLPIFLLPLLLNLPIALPITIALLLPLHPSYVTKENPVKVSLPPSTGVNQV